MSKKSDDSIERIFRQALTQYETTFRESDWLKMEKMLNEEANRRAAVRSKRIKGTAFTLTGLTGLIIAVYFLAFNDPSDSIARLNDSVSEMQAADDLMENGNVKPENPSAGLLSETSPNKSLEKKENNGVTSSDETFSSRLNSNAPGNEEKNMANEEEAATSTATISARDDQSGLKTSPSVQNSLSNSQVNKNSKYAKGNKEVKDPGAAIMETDVKVTNAGAPDLEIKEESLPAPGSTPKHKALSEINIQNHNDLNTDSKLSEQGKQTPLDDHAAQTLDQKSGAIISDSTSRSVAPEMNSAHQTPERLSSDAVGNKTMQKDSLPGDEMLLRNKEDSIKDINEEKAEEKPNINPVSRWSIGVVFAPEFSTTRLGRYSAPGESLGLRIGYQVTNRFNISTGIIRSTKKYEDDGYVYSPRNPAYWQIRTNGVIPEEIKGKCLVYELPLAIQFDAIQTPKARVFISTAISSYFMATQVYDYTFENPNPGADMGWRSKESESYWFSVGMVSAGYERYINRSLAIGIEPYLKISLAEIGWPNVKLFSTGAHVTLRYRFMNRSKNIVE
jgi:hypothetical protein